MSDSFTTSTPASPLLDPAALRIPLAARNSGQRKPLGSDLKVTKPRPDDWAFVHPQKDFHWEHLWAYEAKDKRFYVLSPAIYDLLEENVQRVFSECDFYLTGVLNADPIVWFVRHSDTEYFRTARLAVEAAMTGWVQIQSNQRLKQYDFRRAQTEYAPPDWSDFVTLEDAHRAFTKVFKGRLITDRDHDVLERVRGRK